MTFKEILKYASISNLFPSSKSRDFTFKEYESLIASDFFRNKLFYGIHDKKTDYYCLSPAQRPGLAAIGTMGSGKSTSVSMTTRTHKLSNGDNTLFIMIDPSKGMGDYKDMFDEDGVVVATTTSSDDQGETAEGASKFISMMDAVYNEQVARERLFNRVKAKSIAEFEEIAANPKNKDASWNKPEYKCMARIMVIIEEFHRISQSKKILNFVHNLDREGTAAWQMSQLMRLGRSYGIHFALATQKATYEDLPSEIKPGLNVIQAFRVSSGSDAAAANAPHCQDIAPDQIGRCAVSDGFMQIPYLTERAYAYLREKYGKKYNGHLLTNTVENIKKAAGSGGVEALTMSKPLKLVFSNINQFDEKVFVNRFLGIFGFTTSYQNNPALIAKLIAERDGVRYAVVVVSDNNEFSSKSGQVLGEVMEMLKCEHVIGICLGGRTNALEQLCGSSGNIFMDEDEMSVACDLIDNEKKFETEAQFSERFNSIPLSRESINGSTNNQDDAYNPSGFMGDDRGISFRDRSKRR